MNCHPYFVGENLVSEALQLGYHDSHWAGNVKSLWSWAGWEEGVQEGNRILLFSVSFTVLFLSPVVVSLGAWQN